MEVLSITLPGQTVFWEDLGIRKRSQWTTEYHRLLESWWDEEAGPFLKKITSGDKVVNPHEAGVWFLHSRDALLFKARFSGNLHGSLISR